MSPINNLPPELKSLLQIIENNNPDNPKLTAYEEFISNLKVSLKKIEKKEIADFWKSQEDTSETEFRMSWVDEDELDAARKNILSHPEKRNSKCFQNLVLHKKPLYPDNFDIFDELDKELPNFKEVTEFYRGSFALNASREQSNYQAPRPVLLLGNPGIGKTHYAKKLAKLLGTSYRFFDANSISTGGVLSGHNASWKGADAGLILKELAKSETISPIFLFDEIDKIKSERQYSPFSTFHQLFEKENAKTFSDEFVDLTFDASQIIYILTANNADNIEDSLLSRMTVFNIENPSIEDMKKIIQSIYTNLMDGSKLFTKKLADSEVEKLVHKSPREVTQILSNNIFNQASNNSLDKKTSTRPKKLIVELKNSGKQSYIGF